VLGNFPPHEAFAIGGTNSVRGYEEGAVGSGRSYAVGSGEVSFPIVSGPFFTRMGVRGGGGGVSCHWHISVSVLHGHGTTQDTATQ
jgi:outer membrane protein insertion porin family